MNIDEILEQVKPEWRSVIEANVNFNNEISRFLKDLNRDIRYEELGKILACVIWTMLERDIIDDFESVVGAMMVTPRFAGTNKI